MQPLEHLNEIQDASYLTLSHCWGKPPHDESHMTKLATLAARLEVIHFGGLPKTFQDAIIIARNLEVPYLWIDTFCIIQDSRDDWEKEAASMAKVYSESLCTIAASSSDNWNAGCFVPRDVAKTISCSLNWPKVDGGLGDDVDLTIFPPLPDETLEDCALNQRAWTLQERQLSRRMLHYTDIEIMWECRSWRASESDPIGCPTISYPGYTVIGSTRHPNDEWRDTVKIYSGRNLTHWTDRLSALSGLASQTHMASNGDKYLAGLWRGDLIKDLLWYRASYVEPFWKYSEYLAPTWSWASVIGQVEMDVFQNISGDLLVDDTCGPLVHLAQTIPASRDPFGQISDGFLRLSGCLRKAVSRKGDTDPLGPVFAFPLFDEAGTVIRGSFTPDQYAEPPSDPLYCLRMCTKTWPEHDDGQFLVLVLLPTGRADHEFKRCGAGEIRDTGWFDDCEEIIFTVV